jgi:hypothetical protein
MILPTYEPKEAEALNVRYPQPKLHSSLRLPPFNQGPCHVPPQLVPPALDVIISAGILAACPRCFSSLYIGGMYLLSRFISLSVLFSALILSLSVSSTDIR